MIGDVIEDLPNFDVVATTLRDGAQATRERLGRDRLG